MLLVALLQRAMWHWEHTKGFNNVAHTCQPSLPQTNPVSDCETEDGNMINLKFSHTS